MTKVEMRIDELAEYCLEFDCSEHEALYEILFEFYSCAGFAEEPLEEELASMSDEELMNAYLIM